MHCVRTDLLDQEFIAWIITAAGRDALDSEQVKRAASDDAVFLEKDDDSLCPHSWVGPVAPSTSSPLVGMRPSTRSCDA